MDKLGRTVITSVILVLSGCGGGGGSSSSGADLDISGTWSYTATISTPGFTGGSGTMTLRQSYGWVSGTWAGVAPAGSVPCGPGSASVGGPVSGNTVSLSTIGAGGMDILMSLSGTSTSLSGTFSPMFSSPSPCVGNFLSGTVVMTRTGSGTGSVRTTRKK